MEQEKPPWVGELLTPDVVNGMGATMARVYSLLAWHAATRLRVTLTTLGEVEDEETGQPIGPAEAREIVTELHALELVRVIAWRKAEDTTPLVIRISHTKPPPRLPRNLRYGPGRIKVGGHFTAPQDLQPDLLTDLLETYHAIKALNEVPGADRDAAWMTHLAEQTRRRANAFTRWATIDASRTVEEEAVRLTAAADRIGEQAANRQAEEDRKNRNAARR